jgi:hypothetical protein
MGNRGNNVSDTQSFYWRHMGQSSFGMGNTQYCYRFDSARSRGLEREERRKLDNLRHEARI